MKLYKKSLLFALILFESESVANTACWVTAMSSISDTTVVVFATSPSTSQIDSSQPTSSATSPSSSPWFRIVSFYNNKQLIRHLSLDCFICKLFYSSLHWWHKLKLRERSCNQYNNRFDYINVLLIWVFILCY